MHDQRNNEQKISTWRGTEIDLREDHENPFDSRRINSESVSNEVDESEL
jgi:hypothetical protein